MMGSQRATSSAKGIGPADIPKASDDLPRHSGSVDVIFEALKALRASYSQYFAREYCHTVGGGRWAWMYAWRRQGRKGQLASM